MHENYKRRAPKSSVILACTIVRVKKLAVSESREIVQVAYLGKLTIIRSDRARKLLNERSKAGRDISVHDKLLEKVAVS